MVTLIFSSSVIIANIVDNPEKDLRWGGEVQFKIDVCLRIAEGAKPKKKFRCKIVSILMGDSTFDIMD